MARVGPALRHDGSFSAIERRQNMRTLFRLGRVQPAPTLGRPADAHGLTPSFEARRWYGLPMANRSDRHKLPSVLGVRADRMTPSPWHRIGNSKAFPQCPLDGR